MKKLLVAALIAGSLISAEARAQERAGDAALGAVSGAVVLGPVGAVAGAVIGYTAGPSIAHSWGVRRSGSRSHARRTTQLAKSDPRSSKQNSNIQSDATQNASIQGNGEPAAVKVSSPPPTKSPETPTGAAPPVQGFE
ncbi:MAG: DNA-directed RNA polymerase subunit N [Bradyrhizobium sp.]|nr:DNA-directed RNA polymerase subunit N [Bradyrhizobium sp.]